MVPFQLDTIQGRIQKATYRRSAISGVIFLISHMSNRFTNIIPLRFMSLTFASGEQTDQSVSFIYLFALFELMEGNIYYNRSNYSKFTEIGRIQNLQHLLSNI